MKKSVDIFVLGNFNYYSKKISGQITKTREIFRLLIQKSDKNISYFDIDIFKKSGFNVVLLFFKLIRIRNLVYIPAGNNLRLLFPLLFIHSKLCNYDIHYFVVGGWLHRFLFKHPLHRAMLKRIARIYVETNEMQNILVNKLGFNNIIWFPNFRIDSNALKKNDISEKLKIVFLARITLEKGIDTIFLLLNKIKDSALYDKILIDFYGQIQPDFEKWFSSEIRNHSNTKYLGVVPPDNAQLVISNYDILIFPTRYPGEGCPGTIIDAYMAAVSVLASNWKYNSEFVEDGVTGYLFEPNDVDRIIELVTYLENNRTLIADLGNNAKLYSKKFTQETAWEIAKHSMDLE